MKNSSTHFQNLDEMRSRSPYPKKLLSNLGQVHRMQNAGLEIESEEEAVHWLQTVGYFHLKAYLSCLKNPEHRSNYLPNAKFSDATNLLEWERKLRSVLLEQIGKVELSLKAAIIEIVGSDSGDLYLSEETFDTRGLRNKPARDGRSLTQWESFEKFLDNKIKDFQSGSKFPFVNGFLNRYSDRRIPIWMLIETFTFGEVVEFYQSLHKIYKEPIASVMANPNAADGKLLSVEFEKVLIALKEWRNSAAHFQAFFDKSFPFPHQVAFRMNFTNSGYFPSLRSRERKCKTYGIVLMLMFLSPSLQREYNWTSEVESLLRNFPPGGAKLDIGVIGAPKNWHLQFPWIDPPEFLLDDTSPAKKKDGIAAKKRRAAKEKDKRNKDIKSFRSRRKN